MNSAIALKAYSSFTSFGLDDLLALAGLPLRRRANTSSDSVEDIFKVVASFTDELLQRAIASQSEAEFEQIRDEVFSQYKAASTAFARLVRVVVDSRTIGRVQAEAFCRLEAEFKDEGLSRFGVEVKDQALFTVWSLRKTSQLISRLVAAGPIPDSFRARDSELAERFGIDTTWTQFHVDCLLTAIRFDKPIQLAVLPPIIDGLRAAVDAYGTAREGLNLRLPQEEPLIAPSEWDEEDQDLLDASMHEMGNHLLDD